MSLTFSLELFSGVATHWAGDLTSVWTHTKGNIFPFCFNWISTVQSYTLLSVGCPLQIHSYTEQCSVWRYICAVKFNSASWGIAVIIRQRKCTRVHTRHSAATRLHNFLHFSRKSSRTNAMIWSGCPWPHRLNKQVIPRVFYKSILIPGGARRQMSAIIKNSSNHHQRHHHHIVAQSIAAKHQPDPLFDEEHEEHWHTPTKWPTADHFCACFWPNHRK